MLSYRSRSCSAGCLQEQSYGGAEVSRTGTKFRATDPLGKDGSPHTRFVDPSRLSASTPWRVHKSHASEAGCSKYKGKLQRTPQMIHSGVPDEALTQGIGIQIDGSIGFKRPTLTLNSHSCSTLAAWDSSDMLVRRRIRARLGSFLSDLAHPKHWRHL